MRELKFRAWDKFQNKYVFEGFHIIGEVTCFDCIGMVIHDTWADRSAVMGYKTSDNLLAYNDFELEQYTDKKDDYNTDVYEDDIVYFTIDEAEFTSVVEFSNGGFRVSIGDEKIYIGEVAIRKVMGNRWENPELLEEK